MKFSEWDHKELTIDQRLRELRKELSWFWHVVESAEEAERMIDLVDLCLSVEEEEEK